ncbi:Nitrogen assimilation transcription factor nit-4 [Fusarium oxysporum f. sp. albedinis]|nr:Nitrogen assimilation transcription factor nit-4 [Fusarium oxysporum f. sp. albedinis]
MEIQRLFIYPIKSLLPVEVTYAEVTSEGFRFDRQYILIKEPVDPNQVAEHLTIKKDFVLALFQPSIHDDWSNLTVQHTKAEAESCMTIPLTPSPLCCFQSRTYTVNIAGTDATAANRKTLSFVSAQTSTLPLAMIPLPLMKTTGGN